MIIGFQSFCNFFGGIKLLTRDQGLIDAYPDRTMTPAQYCQRPMDKVPLPFIDLPAQQDRIRPDLERGVHRVLHHGQYILGPEIAELEAALAAYVGVKHCITVASGADSLEIALRALGVGPGDEVITVPFTWISSAEVIGLVGARPVFVGIEPESFTIAVTKIEAAITPRTKAILPVSLFGQMPDYSAINAIAARHGLPVIEDAAQSFGATLRQITGDTDIGRQYADRLVKVYVVEGAEVWLLIHIEVQGRADERFQAQRPSQRHR